MEKIERAKKYAEFIRQQHKSNVVTVQNESSTEDGEGSSEGKSTLGYTKQRFTLGDTEEKKIELQERRKKVTACFGHSSCRCSTSSMLQKPRLPANGSMQVGLHSYSQRCF